MRYQIENVDVCPHLRQALNALGRHKTSAADYVVCCGQAYAMDSDGGYIPAFDPASIARDATRDVDLEWAPTIWHDGPVDGAPERLWRACSAFVDDEGEVWADEPLGYMVDDMDEALFVPGE